MESGRLGTAYRTSAPPGPAAAGPRGKFRRSGNHRGRMLGVLKFKKSLFAGVLDGGEKEIFLGGSRLNRFMETVEKASGAIPRAATVEPVETQSAASDDGEGSGGVPVSASVAAITSAHTAVDPIANLLQTGIAFLQELATVARPGSPSMRGLSFVSRDERTGETYLKVPIPKPEVLDKAPEAISALLESFRR